MLTAEKPVKRAWVPWWVLGDKGLCPNCKVPGKCGSTTKNGGKMQNRKCPKCGEWYLNTVPNEADE